MWWIWIFPCSKGGEQKSFVSSKIEWWTNSIPPRLLNKESKSLIEKISKADDIHTITASVVFDTTGIMLSKHNIAYLSGLCSELQEMDDKKEQNPKEKMINYLKKII